MLSQKLLVLSQTDPEHFPLIGRLGVKDETLPVCFGSEVRDHVPFFVARRATKLTLSALVFLCTVGGHHCTLEFRFELANGLSDLFSYPFSISLTSLSFNIATCAWIVKCGFFSIPQSPDVRVRVRGGRLRFEPLVCIYTPLRSILAHGLQPLAESLRFLGLQLRSGLLPRFVLLGCLGPQLVQQPEVVAACCAV